MLLPLSSPSSISLSAFHLLLYITKPTPVRLHCTKSSLSTVHRACACVCADGYHWHRGCYKLLVETLWAPGWWPLAFMRGALRPLHTCTLCWIYTHTRAEQHLSSLPRAYLCPKGSTVCVWGVYSMWCVGVWQDMCQPLVLCKSVSGVFFLSPAFFLLHVTTSPPCCKWYWEILAKQDVTISHRLATHR